MNGKMIESFALRLAEAIKRIEPEKTASVAVMKFSLEGIINTLITSFIIIVVGLSTSSLLSTFVVMGAVIVFRFFSGGLHLKSALHCSLLSISLISIAPHIPLSEKWVYILTATNLALILIFAPANIKGHARLPTKFFPLLKFISAIIICSNFGLLSSTIAIVHTFQAFSTIEIKRRW
jgi:accessory gene regulator B